LIYNSKDYIPKNGESAKKRKVSGFELSDYMEPSYKPNSIFDHLASDKMPARVKKIPIVVPKIEGTRMDIFNKLAGDANKT
jgi:hypothetical protein